MPSSLPPPVGCPGHILRYKPDPTIYGREVAPGGGMSSVCKFFPFSSWLPWTAAAAVAALCAEAIYTKCVSKNKKKAINDSSKFYAIHPLHRENRWNLRPQLKRFLQIGTISEQIWMSSSSWHECKNCVSKVLVISKKEESHIRIFYFFRVQTRGVLNVFILYGRFLFLQHNIQTLNFGA